MASSWAVRSPFFRTGGPWANTGGSAKLASRRSADRDRTMGNLRIPV